MRRLQSGISALMAVALLASCANDPTSDLRGSPSVISPSLFFTVIAVGGNKTVDVQVRDEQGNALDGTITATSNNPTAVSVEVDTTFRPGLGNSRLTTRFIIRALLPDSARISLSTSGVNDTTITVVGNPSGQTPVSIGVGTATPGDTTTQFLAVGDTVVINAVGNIHYTASTTVTFTPGGPAFITGISNNGQTLSFIPLPGSQGPATITTDLGFGPSLGTITFSTLNKVVVDPLLSSLNDTSVNINDLVTVTALNFKFTPTTLVTIGGTVQHLVSISADSSTLVFRAGASSLLTVAYSDLFLSFLPTLVNSSAEPTLIVTSTITALTGTDAYATAPDITVPAAGSTYILNDVGTPFAASADCGNGPSGTDCRIYKITLTTARDFTVTADWSSLADLGIYFSDGTGAEAGVGTACDAHGNGATAHPETCDVSLAAGTWFIHVGTYAAFYPPPNNVDPTSITLQIDGN